MPFKSDDMNSPESTASTKAERASSLSATQYSELFYYAPNSNCTVNQNAIILSSNQAAGLLLGHPDHELSG